MPTIEVSRRDLEVLSGMKATDENLMLAKAEPELSESDNLKLEIADANRPDLWSAEGIAREMKGEFLEIKPKKSGLKVIVDSNLKDIRPLTVCAVIKNIKITENSLQQLIQLQEKVCETFGRKRKQVAIGVYDYDKIKSPIIYRAFAPEEIEFIPLETNQLMNLKEILENHPKGKEYARLLEGCSKYPIFIDAKSQVLSMPPIINSDYTGKVTTKTRNLFVECSGFDFRFLEPALNTIVYALAQRGGKVNTVEIKYENKTITTPNLSPKKTHLNLDYFQRRAGLPLTTPQILSLLKKSNYKVLSKSKNTLTLSYPSYRQDIMHQADIVEDIIIRYGYNNITPITPQLPTTGNLLPLQELQRKIEELMIGLESQEILSYTLTNHDILFRNMNMELQKAIEIENPISKNWGVFRTWITPCLMEFLGKNIKREYPQKIFEIGKVILPDDNAETRSTNPTHLAYAHADKNTDFTKAKQVLDFLMNHLGIEYTIEEISHPSFIPGRVGAVFVSKKHVALIGEIHPSVLQNWGIEVPVVAFEINLSELRTKD
jgi:phenylalanyl-tRNA synthetase beta chain